MKRNQRGQGLIEYLILVCLVAVSSITVVSIVGQNLKARYATISNALKGEGDKKLPLETATEESYKHRGFNDYFFTSGEVR